MGNTEETNCLYCEHRDKTFVGSRGPCKNKKAVEFRGTYFPYAEMDKKPCPYFKKEPNEE
jgi:hypothetical protein